MDTQLIETARAVDLVSLIEGDLGPGKRSGRWVLFCCPFHDDHHPSLGVTNGAGAKGPYFECYACGEKGSAIDWMMKFNNLDFKQAVQELASGRIVASSGQGQAARRDPAVVIHQAPGEKWQACASQLIEGAQSCLWNEEGFFKEIDWRETDPVTGNHVIRRMAPIDYLFSRGLTEETMRIWKIGYIPQTRKEPAERWGLAGNEITIFQGILIPCLIDNQAWSLKIKAPIPPTEKMKYPQILGSKKALYMLQTLEWNETVVFTEGEFDALLLWQEVEDLAGVVTLGGAGSDFSIADWGLYLLNTRTRLIAYDIDERGEEGAAKLAWLGNSRRVSVPRLRTHDKDITDFWRSGGDLREWLINELDRLQMAAELKTVMAGALA